MYRYNLKGKNAIVTGGGKGIGKAISLRLAEEGANVAIADIDLKESQKVVSEINKMKRKGLAEKIDATKIDEAYIFVEHVIKEFKKIDILINNVGGSARDRPSLFCESAEDTWDYVFKLNLKSTFNFTRTVINYMIENKSGKIVNISSFVGLVGAKMWVDYATAKAGIIGFTRALAKEVASYGINVNAVAPGSVLAGGVLELSNEKFDINKLGQISGLNRIAKPEEIASMVVFLTKSDADFITGQVFPVCGLANLGTY